MDYQRKLIIHVDNPRFSAVTDRKALDVIDALYRGGITSPDSRVTVKSHITHKEEK